ncbi:hypothetical protein A3D42_00505 [Candidatus Nomurabacteria bacterium RIFCSPHIGHO2_02_FULL_41_18]|uniref:Arsenite methyltransferase n=1 Tax=Candidatus Nomurabacteria bacterium RIFCSPHIGHO2_02_FULL_41_18 TaxID=1801754 RepID=A0A1F6W7N8_9BACT|nr:MAG: hypothetical protein A2737_02590 [Candidatus Nomurabacteria bacterium RIFCSPHIGHO2_01_FULL_41_71]OGI77901.1 MAG: hypothetical protein A3D42_00505 [Candidatus Nomurabacteria bacterium RIFCSPHIGHO2_02_FULL_41_18]OGI90075.1 MAG: hypothetical protein A3B01_00925 [Candidatus Nomurabacteria bacterium RIFCSPLOWO2_01_FULL_41_52b]OGJ00190.1 MAG: hypothetical protein A3I90_00100 [Candidatus Nomurabacteria bacterium RIFCSPLOWO2_02_FULL_41_9]
MFTNPLRNLKALGIRERDIVVDLGAGTGFYSIEAARIADGGKVYAVELNRDFLQTIRNKVKETKLGNIECLWGDVEKIGGTKLGDSVADKVIVSNVIFQVENKENFIEETNRILKNGGQALVIDWSADSPLSKKGLSVPKDAMKRMFEQKGFKFDREIDAGEHHYGMIFTKG